MSSSKVHKCVPSCTDLYSNVMCTLYVSYTELLHIALYLSVVALETIRTLLLRPSCLLRRDRRGAMPHTSQTQFDIRVFLSSVPATASVATTRDLGPIGFRS